MLWDALECFRMLAEALRCPLIFGGELHKQFIHHSEPSIVHLV